MTGTYIHVTDTARDTREVWWWASGDDDDVEVGPVLIATVHTLAEALDAEDRHRAEQETKEPDL